MSDFVSRARAWLDSTYQGRVELADLEPIRATERSVLFGCRYADAGEPMLAATICVPADGGEPFPVSNSRPLDEEANLARPPGGEVRPWRWTVNARNCVIAAAAAVDGRPASALAWEAEDESPGWWERMLAAHFPEAEVATYATWSQVGDAIVAGGPGTRGVIWLRRQLNGHEVTGHLLYTQFDEEDGVAPILDPQIGSLASVDDREVERLVLARFHRAVVPVSEHPVLPWDVAAGDLPAAVAKAEAWLDHTYQGEVCLVEPGSSDEARRGWLFACTTKRFLDSGDWREQMLDAALVVPKAAGESPFGLPNGDPWSWMEQWDAGAAGLPSPPAPAEATWFGLMSEQVGRLHTGEPHRSWPEALREIADLPTGEPALIWLRRKDYRERETVGLLLWAVNSGGEIRVFDPTADSASPPPLDAEPFEVRVFRVERSPADATSA
ncbi:YrhB domain-containing protein [Amycolatopsis sp. NPDC059021]|uniref:YrhB domain-containing protein n=1 Tax=Amycolatopsis sp. NPDC059021 TaxID=3346704 RepID=UPI00366C4B5B